MKTIVLVALVASLALAQQYRASDYIPQPYLSTGISTQETMTANPTTILEGRMKIVARKEPLSKSKSATKNGACNRNKNGRDK